MRFIEQQFTFLYFFLNHLNKFSLSLEKIKFQLADTGSGKSTVVPVPVLLFGLLYRGEWGYFIHGVVSYKPVIFQVKSFIYRQLSGKTFYLTGRLKNEPSRRARRTSYFGAFTASTWPVRGIFKLSVRTNFCTQLYDIIREF